MESSATDKDFCPHGSVFPNEYLSSVYGYKKAV